MNDENHAPHLPSPSVWPATVGAGVTLMAFGIPTSIYFCIVGLAILGIGVYGWIQDLRHG